jgi:UTP--glucose-1-phosphate uridylyltransferase
MKVQTKTNENGRMGLLVNFDKIHEKIKKADLPEVVISNFKYYYNQLVNGTTGEISESEIDPVERINDSQNFTKTHERIGQENIHKSAVIKSYGGLGTSMGLQKTKSLLEINNHVSFLDIVARQASQNKVPLVLMNSFTTQRDSLDKLSDFKQSFENIALDFFATQGTQN